MNGRALPGNHTAAKGLLREHYAKPPRHQQRR